MAVLLLGLALALAAPAPHGVAGQLGGCEALLAGGVFERTEIWKSTWTTGEAQTLGTAMLCNATSSLSTLNSSSSSSWSFGINFTYKEVPIKVEMGQNRASAEQALDTLQRDWCSNVTTSIQDIRASNDSGGELRLTVSVPLIMAYNECKRITNPVPVPVDPPKSPPPPPRKQLPGPNPKPKPVKRRPPPPAKKKKPKPPPPKKKRQMLAG